MPVPKFVVPLAGGLVGVVVLGAAAFGLAAPSGNQVTDAPAPTIEALTAGIGSAGAAGAGSVKKPATNSPVAAPGAGSVPNSSGALNSATGAANSATGAVK